MPRARRLEQIAHKAAQFEMYRWLNQQIIVLNIKIKLWNFVMIKFYRKEKDFIGSWLRYDLSRFMMCYHGATDHCNCCMDIYITQLSPWPIIVTFVRCDPMMQLLLQQATATTSEEISFRTVKGSFILQLSYQPLARIKWRSIHATGRGNRSQWPVVNMAI